MTCNFVLAGKSLRPKTAGSWEIFGSHKDQTTSILHLHFTSGLILEKLGCHQLFEMKESYFFSCVIKEARKY